MSKDRQAVSQADIVDLVLRLRSLVVAFPEEARAACQRLSKRTDRLIQTKTEEHRKRVLTELNLLPLAREIALEHLAGRNDHEGPSDLILDPENPPPGFESIGFPAGPVCLRVARAYRVVGRWDSNVKNRLDSEIGFMEAAQTGKFGEWKAASTVTLASTSAVDAYIHALSVPLAHTTQRSRERVTPEDIRRRLDPDERPALGADGWWGMVDMLVALVRPARTPRNTVPSRSACWEVSILALTGADPDFKPTSWGWQNAPDWQEGFDEAERPPFADRGTVMDSALHFAADGPGDNERLWQAVSTAIQVLESQTAPSPPGENSAADRGGTQSNNERRSPEAGPAGQHIDPAPLDPLITLDQAAAVVNRSKRHLERLLQQGRLPPPDFPGGGGKAHRWRWKTLVGALRTEFRPDLPDQFPGSRIV